MSLYVVEFLFDSKFQYLVPEYDLVSPESQPPDDDLQRSLSTFDPEMALKYKVKVFGDDLDLYLTRNSRLVAQGMFLKIF